MKDRPNNDEVIIGERELLGLIMSDQTIMENIAPEIVPSDFYWDPHGVIYAKMLELWSTGEKIDYLSLMQALKPRFKASELIEITKGVLPVASYPDVVRRLKRGAVLRRLQASLGSLAERLERKEIEPEAVETEISQILNPLRKETKWELADAVFEKVLTEVNSPRRGLRTGFASLDSSIGGMCPGDLICLAGGANVGKTSFLLNLTCHNIKESKTSLIFSCEMRPPDIMIKVISYFSGINSFNFRRGLTEQEKYVLLDLQNKVYGYPFIISSEKSIEQIVLTAKQVNRKYRLEFVGIDYLQLIDSVSLAHADNRSQYLGKIVRDLKGMALELDIPVVFLSQLNRDFKKEHRLPNLQDLRDSGEIEQHTDIVMFLCEELVKVRASDDTEKTLEKQRATEEIRFLMLGKARMGPKQSFFKLKYDGARMKYSEITNEYKEEEQ